MSALPTLGAELHAATDIDDIQPIDDDMKEDVEDEKVEHPQGDQPALHPDERRALGARAEEAGIAVAADFELVAEQMMTLSDEDAVDILLESIEVHEGDPNFPHSTWQRITALVHGAKQCEMSEPDWSFRVRAEAAIIHFHSPYPEVRSVTVPFDDGETPCETLRVYFIGTIFICGSTALNAFFQPRQPSISLGANVLQLLVWPCGVLASKILPDWGFNFMGSRHSLNPGPWSYKEQVFSVNFFDITSGFGNLYSIYLIQRLPNMLKQAWATVGYELCLGLSVQYMGFCYAGILRRFAVYPVTQLWPSVLPTLALSRTLTQPEKKGEKINGWKLTRYQFFGLFATAMFIWFWIPNFLFGALRAFNWMTWIAPNNFNLAIITGFYGGMGFNPWATFDYNVSGQNKLTTPFFSSLQSMGGMLIAGFVIIGLYYTNAYWTAYMPINSNSVYDNTGAAYNPQKVLTNGTLDKAKYDEYGPAYYSAYNILQHGQAYAWNVLIVFYVNIRYWKLMKRSLKGIAKTFVSTASVYAGNNDAQIRLYKKYPEVPEWWFFAMMIGSLGLGVAALVAWPTHTPWWSILVAAVLGLISIVPCTFILGQANVSIDTGSILSILASAMFPQNVTALLIFTTFGTNNLEQSRSYASDVKMGLYARIPPRTLFRGQMWSVFVQTFVFVVVLNWLVENFDNDGTLCTTANKDHFVCNTATHDYGNAIEVGMLGVNVLLSQHPILKYTFLIGGMIGIIWGCAEIFGPRFMEHARRTYGRRALAVWEAVVFTPFHYLGYINPAIFWSGAHNWGGANNLSYQINGLYLSFGFMYYLKRRYPAWWEKYNYLLQMAFDVGVALSGLVQTLATKFGPHPISAPVWWGNTVSIAGIDYKIYNSKASRLTVPKGGYFGIPKGQFPNPFRN